MALTEKDLRAFRALISEAIQSEVPAIIKAEIKGLATVADTDQIMGELQTIRQEFLFMSAEITPPSSPTPSHNPNRTPVNSSETSHRRLATASL